MTKPQPPAAGEVAELVEWLQDCANVRNDEGYTSLGVPILPRR